MSDVFTLPRQSCRCGHTFGSLRAHLAHAELAEPLPHDHPAKVGLVQVDGEWVVKPRPEPVKASRRAASGPAVRPAPNPLTGYERVCKLCGATFLRPRTRGRPPTKCEACR